MSRLKKAVTLGLIIGIAGVLISFLPFAFHLEEDIGLDILFDLRGQRQAPADVVVVSMDSASAKKLNIPEDPVKWPRNLHAGLVETLAKEGASVIVFDIIFNNAHTAKEDALFAETMRKVNNVVLCKCLKSEKVPVPESEGSSKGEVDIVKFLNPLPRFEKSAFATAPFPLPKVPVKLNRYWTFKKDAGDIPTLPVVAFQIYSIDAYDDFIRLLEKVSPSQAQRLPYDRKSIFALKGIEKIIQDTREIFENNPWIAEKMLRELQNPGNLSYDDKKRKQLISLIKLYRGTSSPYLNFYGQPGAITTISYGNLLHRNEDTGRGNHYPDLKGKAVFVGISELFKPEQKDGFYTVFSKSNGVDLSGVEIAATAFANILEDNPVKPVSIWIDVITIFIWGAVIGILCILFPNYLSAMSLLILGSLYLAGAYYQFKTGGIWFLLVTPLFFQMPAAFFSAVILKYVESNRERKNIRKAFEFYLPDNVVDQLVKNLGNIKTGGQTVHGICLYTDAKQYTTLSEKMEPHELGSFMNRYYATIFEPVRRHGGVVSNVIGDSMLALWVTAHSETAIERSACLAALDIVRALHISSTFQLPTRISIHSGPIFMGNIGAIDHYEYRPLGDIVNTATRIDALNKYLGTRILVSEAVAQKLDGFLTRELGKFLLAGKSMPVVIYELVCRMEECTEQQRESCDIFSEAIDAFRLQLWERAAEKFHEYQGIVKDDEPSEFYLNLCEEYKKNPPGESWKGEIYVGK